MSSASSPDFLTILDSFIKPVDQVRSSETEILQQVRKYFNSIQVTDNPVVLSLAKQRKINFMINKLQHIACNPNRIQVIDSQVQALFELPWDTDMLLLLSTYYSCFYLTTAKSKPVLSKKDDLINELLYAVYHDVVSKLIENEMSYDDYFSNHIVLQLGTTKDPRVLKTYGIIEEVANDYQLTNEEVVAFIVNCRKKRDIAETNTKKDEASENWPVRYLYEYIRSLQQPENSTLKDFLHEKKLHDLFTTAEIAKYEVLFKCYVTKLIKKEIRTLMAGKVAA